jgi:hypothetical protein
MRPSHGVLGTSRAESEKEVLINGILDTGFLGQATFREGMTYRAKSEQWRGLQQTLMVNGSMVTVLGPMFAGFEAAVRVFLSF